MPSGLTLAPPRDVEHRRLMPPPLDGWEDQSTSPGSTPADTPQVLLTDRFGLVGEFLEVRR